MTAAPLRIAMCCRVRERSPGPFLRCLALAEELLSRNVEVLFVTDTTSSPWAAAQLEARAIPMERPPATAEAYTELLERREVAAVVLDPAGELRDVCAAVRGEARPTVAVVEAEDDVGADIVVDPRLDARERRPRRGSAVLTGPEYVMLRNDVLANRPISPGRRRGADVPKVLVALDEPASTGSLEAVARVLVESGAPFDATLATSTAEAGERVAAVPTAQGQRLSVVAPGIRLHERASRSDVIIATASDRAYEWLALGSALGLLWSAEEEVELYRRLMVRRAVVGLGSLAGLGHDMTPVAEKVQRLLLDSAERIRLGERAWHLVDGLGRARVVDALLERVR